MTIGLIDVDGGKRNVAPDYKGKIYIIRNRINDKVYVGQTMRTLHSRFKEHIDPKQCGHGDKFHAALHELGTANFYIELLEDNIPESELDDRERYWIAEYNSYDDGYNSNLGGHGWGKIYVSDRMLRYYGVKDLIDEYRTTQDKIRKREVLHEYCSKMKEIFPSQNWDGFESLFADD